MQTREEEDRQHTGAQPVGPQLFIAEDDADDRLLIQEALNDCGVPAPSAMFFADGEELIDGLLIDPSRARIVLLDLNMPRMDGRQALQRIKTSDELKHIPVIVFTTSNAVEDIQLTYRLGGNTYFTKPARYEDLIDVVSVIKAYWLERATLGSDEH